MFRYSISSLCVCTIFLLLIGFQTVPAQKFDNIERGRMKDILKSIKRTIEKEYYDPTYRGIDLNDRFKKADERLSQVSSTDQALGVIAQVVIEFNDSHLQFLPPATTLLVEYGWREKMFGDKCFVTDVKPGSDAEKKGLKAGDQILAIENFPVNRSEMWKMYYYYHAISKRSRLTLAVASPGDTAARKIEIESEIKRQPASVGFNTYFRLYDDFYEEKNYENRYVTAGGIVVWKMPSFSVSTTDIDRLVERPKQASSVILDLRGNGGGAVVALERMVGHFFPNDLKIADLKGRKAMDPMFAKTRGADNVYKGKIVVLIDSKSASAAEIFARVIQLEKRGTVIGDVSAGAVMQSRQHRFEMGGDKVVPYGVSVTNADVIMSDGKSLEHVGVQPDELILPSAEDLAAGRDPVMVRAFEILGGSIDPQAAGKMFPYYFKMK